MSLINYKLIYDRHTFRADNLTLQPSDGYSQIYFAELRSGSLALRTSHTDGPAIGTASYPKNKSVIKLHLGPQAQKTKLEHSWVRTVNPYGQTTENPNPKKGFWSGRVKDGSIGCYKTFLPLPGGQRLRWEAVGTKEAPSISDVKMRCVLVDASSRSGPVVGEMTKSNDVIRLMNLQGMPVEVGICVLLGFVSLYERARARNSKQADLNPIADFMIDGSGGDGGGGGGDGGGGGGGDGGGGGGGC